MIKEFKGYTRGMNLGGWFSQCDYSEDRFNNFITEKDFERIASWGLDHVRLPIDYNLVEDKDGNYIEKGFERLDEAIGWAKKYGLNLILDLHKTFGFSFDDGENEDGFFENEAYQERFYRLWETLAKRYGKNEDMMAFELLNEVTEKEFCDAWNRISTECIKRIRVYAPTIKILVGGYYNNALVAVKDIAMPVDENIVYNFHCYEPLVFTHQGAYWIKTMPLDYRMNFEATYKEYQEASKRVLDPRHNQFGEYGFNDDDIMGQEYFERLFAEAVRVSEERDVCLYCGEYGVINLTTPEETLKWYRAINPVFKKHNIGRAAWSYHEMDFGLGDSRYDEVRDELLELL